MGLTIIVSSVMAWCHLLDRRLSPGTEDRCNANVSVIFPRRQTNAKISSCLTFDTIAVPRVYSENKVC